MSGVNIQVQGLEALKKKYKELPKAVEDGLDAELNALALEYEGKAVSMAPVKDGYLKNNITSLKVSPLNYEVVSGAPYSAYLEFGTITRVVVPTDLVEFAARFKGKGIRKTGGIYPHPFFFPHLPWARTEVQQRSEKVVKNALK